MTLTRYARTSSFFIFQFFVRRRRVCFWYRPILMMRTDILGGPRHPRTIFFFQFFVRHTRRVAGCFFVLLVWVNSYDTEGSEDENTNSIWIIESTTGHHTECITPSAREIGIASCDGSFKLLHHYLFDKSHIFFFCCRHSQPSRCHLPILLEVEIIYRLLLELCSKKE